MHPKASLHLLIWLHDWRVYFTRWIQTLMNFINALLQKIYSSSVQCDGLPVDQQVAAWRSDRHQTERSGWWSSPGARPGLVTVSNHRAAGGHETGSRKCQTCGLRDQRCTQPNTTLYLMCISTLLLIHCSFVKLAAVPYPRWHKGCNKTHILK